jgi:hypothetical protein
MMEHMEAVRLRAAERYVLKQLSAAETEAFEEHFFSCTECAEEVRWISMFEQNAKRVVSQKVRETPAEFVTFASLEPGAEAIVVLPEYARNVVLSINVPADGWSAKQISLATGGGTARFTMAVPAEQVSEGRIHVMLKAAELDPGRHILTLVSSEGNYLEFPFAIRID